MNQHQDNQADENSAEQLDRREFLLRSAKTGAMIAAAGGLSWTLLDIAGPAAKTDEELVRFGDYSVADVGAKMAIITGSDRKATVSAGLKAIGGIEQFVKRGDKVLLKVNAAFSSPPIVSATTHPDLVFEVVRLCIAAGAASVAVTDNPINDPASCFGISGISAAAKTAGAKLVLPKTSYFKPTSVIGGKLIVDWPVLYEPLAGVDKVIGISPVKHHERSGASMSMKNWYGLLGGRRNKLHQDIHNTIKELSMLLTPTLVILDGTRAMMHNGPTGGSLADLKETNTMIVSTDQVAADAFGATLLGASLADLPYISKAAAVGSGTADWESLNPIRSQVPEDHV